VHFDFDLSNSAELEEKYCTVSRVGSGGRATMYPN